MSRIIQQPTADLAWSQDDWDRADQALNRVFEDQDWPADEVEIRQNLLIEHLGQAGISRALARSLIDRLLARGVFLAGKSFCELRAFVRFDGQQTATSTPNRLLITSLQRWAAYRNKQQSANRRRVRRQGPKRVTATAPRDQRLEARDEWIYHQCCDSQLIYRKILSELRKLCPEKSWRPIGSVQGLRAIAKNYAARHRLPMPPRRQDL
jgi:hypothetical protein